MCPPPRPICGCFACAQADAQAHPSGNPLDPRLTRMFLCATCGNKRCPHATDHRNDCTGSNEPGQPGSSYPAPNPFAGLPKSTHKVIEQLLHDIYAAGEWTDEHETILDEWRDARGDSAKEAWTWWVGEDADEPYACDARSREDAIRCGHEIFSHEGRFRIVEARMWADNVKEGEDETGFAEIRNGESFRCVLPPIPASSRAVDLAGISLSIKPMSQAEAEARGLA